MSTSDHGFRFHTIMDAPCPVYLRVPNCGEAMTPCTDHGLTIKEARRLRHELDAVLEPFDVDVVRNARLVPNQIASDRDWSKHE